MIAYFRKENLPPGEAYVFAVEEFKFVDGKYWVRVKNDRRWHEAEKITLDKRAK